MTIIFELPLWFTATGQSIHIGQSFPLINEPRRKIRDISTYSKADIAQEHYPQCDLGESTRKRHPSSPTLPDPTIAGKELR